MAFDKTAGTVPPNPDMIAYAKWAAMCGSSVYLREMGVDNAVLSEASAIPHDSLGHLPRDEMVHFGFDRRDFAETSWRFIDKPAPAIRKLFFVRGDSGQPRYVNGFVTVSLRVGRLMLPMLWVLGASISDSDPTAPQLSPPSISA